MIMIAIMNVGWYGKLRISPFQVMESESDAA